MSSMNTPPPKKIRKPYRGIRKLDNFTIDYSMERLIFTVDTGKEKLRWKVDKSYVTSYPNFQKISDYDLWKHYTYHVLPQIKQYYEYIAAYYSNSMKTESDGLKTINMKSYL